MPSGSTHPTRRAVFLSVSAGVAVVVAAFAHEVLLPFVLAAVIAYVLAPLVAVAERRGLRRGLAVVLVYAVVFGALGGFARAVSPRIAHEVRALVGELPAFANQARARWVPAVEGALRALGVPSHSATDPEPAQPPSPDAIVLRPLPSGGYAVDVGAGLNVVQTGEGWRVEPARRRLGAPLDLDRLLSEAVGRTFAYAQHNSLALARIARNLVFSIARAVFVFFITLMVAAYMMVTRERIKAFLRSLLRPEAGPSFDALLGRIDRGLSGVVRGQLVICCVNGLLSAVGFAFIGLKYWPVMALVSAIFSLVPIFGSIASAVPAVALGLTQNLAVAALVLGWIVVVHQIEANLLNPKIMGDSAKIHPVLVIFALIFGEHFFHIAGALLAVPVMSIAQSVFLHFKEVVETERQRLVSPTPSLPGYGHPPAEQARPDAG